MTRLLLIEPDAGRREELATALEECGFDVTPAEGMPRSRGNPLKDVAVVLLSLRSDDVARLGELRRADPLVPVVAYGEDRPTGSQVSALGRERVYDVVQLAGPDSVAGASRRLRSAVDRGRKRRAPRVIAEEILGSSEKMAQVRRYIGRAAESDANVLLIGESGTGKELVARAVHGHSDRREGPFVAVNCAAIPETLLESLLFGHEKGSFTGAVGRTRGKFEVADGGTLFFDEIGDMPPALQAKILRVLQPPPGEAETLREFTRVGEEAPSRADVRLVFATNRNLNAEVKEGRFREDLYQRIRVLLIQVPPLRDRREDVPLLAERFLERYGRLEGLADLEFDPLVLDVLQRYDFPLNVRELEGLVRSIVVLKDTGSTVVLGDLPPEVFGQAALPEPGPPSATVLRSLAEVQAEHVLRVLDHCRGNKSKAAGILGISRPALDRKLSRARSDR